MEESLTRADVDEYIRAQREREILRRKVLALFEQTDILLMPALPCIAPRIDDLKAIINGKGIEYSLSLTQPFLTLHNLTGFPAMVVPMGFSKKEKMPLSLQIIGKPWEEAEVFRAAYAYEEATPELRTQHPELE